MSSECHFCVSGRYLFTNGSSKFAIKIDDVSFIAKSVLQVQNIFSWKQKTEIVMHPHFSLLQVRFSFLTRGYVNVEAICLKIALSDRTAEVSKRLEQTVEKLSFHFHAKSIIPNVVAMSVSAL